MDLVALLETFCPPLGPPGREDEIREALAQWLIPRVNRLETDPLGNLQAYMGPGGGPRVMLDAHMDETAFIVQRVDEKGFLRIAPLGAVDQRILPGSRVVIQPGPDRRLPGVVGVAPPHVAKSGDSDKAIFWDQIFVDLGMDGAEAQAAGVQTGVCGVLEGGMGRMGKNCFQARSLDDRAGCVALLALIQGLQETPPAVELVFNFAVAEEVGLRGAGPAAFSLNPDLALVCEATIGDTPGLDPSRQPSLLGQGPAITVADGRIVVPSKIVDSLEGAASRAGVACQRKLPPYGGTNAGSIHTAGPGIPTGVVSVPVRYIHTPAALLNLTDLEGLVALIHAWVNEVPALLTRTDHGVRLS